MKKINRRQFLKLAGTASLTAIFGFSLTGCAEEQNNPAETSKNYEPLADNKKYFAEKQHHFYIEVSTETNGEALYYEENISQTSNFIPVKGAHVSGRIAGKSNTNNNSYNNYNSSKYYGSSNNNIFNNFTSGLLFGTIILNNNHLQYGNTEANQEQNTAINIPDGYEITNVEELKNEDYIYGYKIHFENTVPIETHGFEDENGNVSYPYPGEITNVKSEQAAYVKKII